MTSLFNSLSDCPLCHAKGSLFRKISKTSYEHQFEIHKCRSCSMCYTHPMPAADLLTRIYSGEYWLRENKASAPTKTTTGLVQKFNRARLAAMVRPLTRRLKPGDAILEVGCGSGQLALYLKQCGFKVDVTDVSQEILDEIADKYEIQGYCGDLQAISINDRQYHAVIFNNVLEHLDAPGKNLQKASQLLGQGGFIFIEVPNIASVQFKLFRGNWFPLQLPEHLFHFSPDSLQMIAAQCGLEQVWLSTFSPRVSPAGYVVSIFPFLRPDRLRCSMSKPLLVLYLVLQILFLPIAFIESLFGMGSAVRVIFRKQNEK